MTKIPVYMMPGLAASSRIFENIILDEALFEVVWLDWMMPLPNESLVNYSKRFIAQKIHHANPVLIGVSFGGVIVQELSKVISVRKTIIISSVKSNTEFPRRFKMAKSTKAYKLIPTTLFENIEMLVKFSFGSSIVKQRLALYEKFLAVRDKRYLDWAIEQIINWNRIEIDEEIIHIHGDADEVFPPKYIKDFIPVKNGTHIMILSKYKWLNENLPKILLGD